VLYLSFYLVMVSCPQTHEHLEQAKGHPQNTYHITYYPFRVLVLFALRNLCKIFGQKKKNISQLKIIAFGKHV